MLAQTPTISINVQQAQLAIQLNYTRWSGLFSSHVSLAAGLMRMLALCSCTRQIGAVANIPSCAGQVVLDTSQVQWVLLQDINVTVGPVSNATVDRRGDTNCSIHLLQESAPIGTDAPDADLCRAQSSTCIARCLLHCCVEGQ